MNQVNRKPSQELEPEPESTVVTDIDPAELEKVEAIDAPIWEGITNLVIDPDLAEVAEVVNGTAMRPDWNLVDDLGDAAGIEIPNGGILPTSEILEHRDDNRWELDPQSAKDYEK